MKDSIPPCTESAGAIANVESLSPIQVFGSVLAAAFGVQSKANKRRDFTRGKPLHFIFAGAICTGLLLVSLIAVVNAVT